MFAQNFFKNFCILLIALLLLIINIEALINPIQDFTNQLNLINLIPFILPLSFILIGISFLLYLYGSETYSRLILIFHFLLILVLIIHEFFVVNYFYLPTYFNLIYYILLLFSSIGLFQLYRNDPFRTFPWISVVSQIFNFSLALFCLLNVTLWSKENHPLFYSINLSWNLIFSTLLFSLGLFLILKIVLKSKSKFIFLWRGIYFGTLFFLLFIVLGYSKFIYEKRNLEDFLAKKSKNLETIIRKKFNFHVNFFKKFLKENKTTKRINDFEIYTKIFPYLQGIKKFGLLSKNTQKSNNLILHDEEFKLIYESNRDMIFLRKNNDNTSYEMIFVFYLENDKKNKIAILYDVDEFFKSILPEYILSGFETNIQMEDKTVYQSSINKEINLFTKPIVYTFNLYDKNFVLKIQLSKEVSGSFISNIPLMITLLGIITSFFFGATFYFFYISNFNREKAKQANAIKNSFLMNISHEIRTPLNGIIGTSSLMLNLDLNQKLEHYVKIIYSSGKQLLSILNDILDISKIESGNIVLNYTAEDLHHLIKDTINTHISKANEKKLNLLLYYPHLFVDKVLIDSLRFRQILNNLLNNALKFTHSGSIVVDVSIKNKSDEIIILKVSIEDTGIGINKNDIEKIYETFTQVDSSSTRKYGGNGLGLSISKNLINILGGVINVKSDVNVGSTFTVELPLKVLSCRVDTIIDPRVETLDRKNVLLFSENSKSKNIIQNYLNKFGMKFYSYYKLEDVFEILKLQEMNFYDFVIFDLQAEENKEVVLQNELTRNNLFNKSSYIILTPFPGKNDDSSEIITMLKPFSSYDFLDVLVHVLMKKNLKR